MKKSIAIIAAVAATVVVTPPANASTPGCVDHSEFEYAYVGQKQGQVRRIFDTGGQQISLGGGWQTREYRTCDNPAYGFVKVQYRHRNGAWRLYSKYAYWG